MKKLLMAAAAFAIVSPALIASPTLAQSPTTLAQKNAPNDLTPSTDPDPRIRNDIKRDPQQSGGGGARTGTGGVLPGETPSGTTGQGMGMDGQGMGGQGMGSGQGMGTGGGASGGSMDQR